MRTLTLQETEIVSGGLLGPLGWAGGVMLGAAAITGVISVIAAPITIGMSLPIGLGIGGTFALVGAGAVAVSLLVPVL